MSRETVAVAKGHRYQLKSRNHVIPGQNVSAFVQDYTGTDTQVQRYLIELIHAQSSCDNLYHRWDETKLVRIAESAITCGTKLSTSTKA